MELDLLLKRIYAQFKVENTFKDFKTFNSGHINDTYLICTNKKPFYILQKLNGNVFKNAKEVIKNKITISRFLLANKVNTIEFIETKNNAIYYKDENGNFWNLSIFIEDSKTIEKVASEKIALEAGKISGAFLGATNSFTEQLFEVLPNFHSMSFRYQQFENALLNGNQDRIKECAELIYFISTVKQEMLALDHAIENKEIQKRVTHNDTKVSNVLFDKDNNAICMIDLDTVMLGIVHFDYGDALRTICNTAEEDEKDLKKVNFNIEYFKNYTTGFLNSTGKELTKNELKYLAVSPKIMTFIMAIRFLTDYLNNDIYYKISYKEHNLVRAKNQITLVEKIAEHQNEINNYIKSIVF